MQDAVLLLFRHLIQYVSDHPEDHECHEDKEDLLILQHAEGSAFVLQIIQLKDTAYDIECRFVLQVDHGKVLRVLVKKHQHNDPNDIQ